MSRETDALRVIVAQAGLPEAKTAEAMRLLSSIDGDYVELYNDAQTMVREMRNMAEQMERSGIGPFVMLGRKLLGKLPR